MATTRVLSPPDGWDVIATGGNCTAWQYRLTPYAYVLLTQAGDPSAPMSRSDRATVGIYGRDDRQLVGLEFATVAEALRAVAAIAFVEETRSLTYPGMAAAMGGGPAFTIER